jgi:hypothetical protein
VRRKGRKGRREVGGERKGRREEGGKLEEGGGMKKEEGGGRSNILSMARAKSVLETSLMTTKSIVPSPSLACVQRGPGEIITLVTLPA